MVSNEETTTATAAVQGNGISFKHKYRELKRRLKYLVYENECFENDVKELQSNLLLIDREKSYLLDRLMTHETVIVSGDSDIDSTDYSSEEEFFSQTDAVTRKTIASKLSTSAGTSNTTTQRQPVTKTAPSRGASKKQTVVRGSNKQTVATKTVKNASKIAVSTKPPPSLATLIVSLPITNITTSHQKQETKLITHTIPNQGGIGLLAEGRPMAIGGKGKRKRSSSSSSSGSSSSDSSSESGSGSSDSSDSERNTMDLAPPPPPPPLLVNTSAAMGNKVVQPKPIQSPIRLMPPGQLTSLAGIPLLSPTTSSSTVVPFTSKQTTGFVPLATHLTSSSKTPFITSIGGKQINISAFHIVKSGKEDFSSNDKLQNR